jgi:hypothetical protein
MYSALNGAALPAPGFPIRKSADQRLFSAFPRLIAAVHVLLRLLVPRHPPHALSILTVSLGPRAEAHGRAITRWPLCSFQASPRPAPRRTSARDGLSKLSSARRHQSRPSPVDVSGSAGPPGRHAPRPARGRAKELPRKEVIQPQLPLRLPCYDFTPITSPTFDGSLPCGLGHRLRVLPAFVV